MAITVRTAFQGRDVVRLATHLHSVACFGLLAASVATYREWLVGGIASLLLIMLPATAGSLLIRSWGESARLSPLTRLALAAVVLVPGPAVYGARLVNRQAVVERSLEHPVLYGRLLIPKITGEGRLSVRDELSLEVPAHSLGYFEVRLPELGPERWYLPSALLRRDHPFVREEFTWTAAISRERTYFIALDTGNLLVQVTPWGLLVDVQRPGATLFQRSLTVRVTNGELLDWSLVHHARTLTLRIGGTVAVSLPDMDPPPFVRIGETRSDAEHGGSLRLTALRYTRALARNV